MHDSNEAEYSWTQIRNSLYYFDVPQETIDSELHIIENDERLITIAHRVIFAWTTPHFYREIGNHLRGNECNVTQPNTVLSQITPYLYSLYRACSNRIKFDTLYRGIKTNEYYEKTTPEYWQRNIGIIQLEFGFMATTKEKSVAIEFTKDKGILFVFEIDDYAVGCEVEHSRKNSEKEVLLSPIISFIPTRVIVDGENITTVYCTILSQGEPYLF